MSDTELWLKVSNGEHTRRVSWTWFAGLEKGALTISDNEDRLLSVSIQLNEQAAKHLAQWLAYWRG